MAPTLQDITSLKDLANQLQDRITKIERSMKGEGATTAETVRMILMGPPGAGMLTRCQTSPPSIPENPPPWPFPQFLFFYIRTMDLG